MKIIVTIIPTDEISVQHNILKIHNTFYSELGDKLLRKCS